MTIKLLCRADILVPWRLLSWNPSHPHQPLPGGSQSLPLYSNYSCIHIVCGFNGSKGVLIDFTLQIENQRVWSSMRKPPEITNANECGRIPSRFPVRVFSSVAGESTRTYSK